jgi:hypothetical protein
MTAATIADVHAHLEALFDRGAIGQLTDSELLERFVDGAGEESEAAFAREGYVLAAQREFQATRLKCLAGSPTRTSTTASSGPGGSARRWH